MSWAISNALLIFPRNDAATLSTNSSDNTSCGNVWIGLHMEGKWRRANKENIPSSWKKKIIWAKSTVLKIMKWKNFTVNQNKSQPLPYLWRSAAKLARRNNRTTKTSRTSELIVSNGIPECSIRSQNTVATTTMPKETCRCFHSRTSAAMQK